MKTLPELANFLRDALKRSTLTQLSLGARAGIARRTLTGVLSGVADYKVTTLLAILDRLGYEMVIIPKEAAQGAGAHISATPTEPKVQTIVARARFLIDSSRTGNVKKVF